MRIGENLILYVDLDDVKKLDRWRAGFQGDNEHKLSMEAQNESEEKERQRLQALDEKAAIETQLAGQGNQA